jgi:gamma-F420-2:alpha-L-glutamate ligase
MENKVLARSKKVTGVKRCGVTPAAPATSSRSHKALATPYARRRPRRVRGTAYQTVRKRVIILAWGDTSGYENGGLLESLRRYGIEAKLCHPDHFGIKVGAKLGLTYEGHPLARPALVLARTGSATGSHAEAILRQFELMGVPVVNPITAIQAAMNKAHAIQKMARAGLPVPLTHIHTSRKALRKKVEQWKGGYPCVVKILTGSHGNGVIQVKSPSDLKAYIGFLKAVHHRDPFIIQQFVGRPGEDLRVFIIGGKAIGAMKRTATDGDFRAGISANGKGSSFELTPEIAHISEMAARLLGLEIAGVDLLFSGDSVLVSEINSAPGFAGFERYCSIDIAGLIAKYVADKLASPPLLKAS